MATEKVVLLISFCSYKHLHHLSKIKSHKEVKKQYELRFLLLFCLVIEGSEAGSGSVSVSRTNESGSGRPKKYGSGSGSGSGPATLVPTSVSDLYSFDTYPNPDPAFMLNTDPDPGF
jgi:hypothetical protein